MEDLVSEMFVLNPETHKVVVAPHLLLISPFKEIWERDKEDKKPNAIDDLTYVFFMTDLRKLNPYRLEAEKKSAKIINDIFDGKYKNANDELILKAVKKREDWNESLFTYQFYQSALKLAHKLKSQLETIDTTEKTKNGSLVLKPADVFSAIERMPNAINKLKEQELSVYEEFKVKNRARGNKDINIFEQ